MHGEIAVAVFTLIKLDTLRLFSIRCDACSRMNLISVCGNFMMKEQIVERERER